MSADRLRERGAALAELSVVVPVMLAMLLVVFDFGRGFHAYMSVTNGARHAARVAMQDDKTCSKGDLQTFAQNGSSPYSVTMADPVETDGLCYVTVSYTYSPVVPFVTSQFSLPVLGSIGPLWDGTMSETAVAKVDGKTGSGGGSPTPTPSAGATATPTPAPTATPTAAPTATPCPYEGTSWEWLC